MTILMVNVLDIKGKWQQKFLLPRLKETLKVIYRSLYKFFISVLLWEILSPE